jgi:hypothetical protein
MAERGSMVIRPSYKQKCVVGFAPFCPSRVLATACVGAVCRRGVAGVAAAPTRRGLSVVRAVSSVANGFACVVCCGDRFPVAAVKELLRGVLRDALTEKQSYSTETSKEIADTIKNRLKGALA